MHDYRAIGFIKMFDECFYTALPQYKAFFYKPFRVTNLTLFDMVAIAELSTIHPVDKNVVELRPDPNSLMTSILVRIRSCDNPDLRQSMLERIAELEVWKRLFIIEPEHDLNDVQDQTCGDSFV